MRDNMNIDWSKIKAEYVLGVEDYNKDTYLFREQISAVTKICENFFDSCGNIKLNVNKTIGIVGERGSGKSSFMGTLRNQLSDYHVFNLVDPSIFDDSLSILELFMSEIYKSVNESDSKITDYNSNLHKHKIDIIEQIKNMTGILSNLRIEKSKFASDNPTLEILKDISNRTSFDKILDNLVESYLEYFRKKDGNKVSNKALVLCIDDIDLINNKNIYNMLEDISKYLSKKIIVILAYREVQLLDSIIDEKVTENINLINSDVIDLEEIKDQSSKYIEKLIPNSQRVYLSKMNDVINKPFKQLIEGIAEGKQNSKFLKEFIESYQMQSIDNECTIGDWIYKALYHKTRLQIKPVDHLEQNKFVLPTNLRGVLQLIELIHVKMSPVKYNGTFSKSIGEKIRKNIMEYKTFLLSNCVNILNKSDNNLVLEWNDTVYDSKNYFLYRELLNRIYNQIKNQGNIEVYNKANLTKLLQINEVQSYNVTLGDVYQIFEEYKKIETKHNSQMYLVYFMKVLYSIELLDNYLGAFIDINQDISIIEKIAQERIGVGQDYLEKYIKLINVKIIPDDFMYYDIESKNIFSFYNDKNLLLDQSNSDSETSDKEVITKETYESFINKVVYSSVAARGEVTKGTRSKIKKESLVSEEFLDRLNISTKYPSKVYFQNSIFQYREAFSFDIKLKDNTNYYFDPFSFAGKKEYVLNSFKPTAPETYIFYSLFDIDVFVRMNFFRHSEEFPFHYMLSKINRILTTEISRSANVFEHDLQKHLSTSIFGIMDENKCQGPFTTEELEYSKYFDKLVQGDSNIIQGIDVNYVQQINKKDDLSEVISTLLDNKRLSLSERNQLKQIASDLHIPKTRIKSVQRETVVSIVKKYGGQK